METDIAKLIAIDQVPINLIVKSEVIRSLFEHKYKRLPPSNFETLFDCLRQIETKMICSIKELVANAKSITICADEWTSRTNSRFLNIQAYIDNKKISLGLVRIFERCTGAELSRLIREHLEKFNIKTKFITTDGAANMAVCARELGIVQIKCMLHGVNLGILLLKKIINKITTFTYINSSLIYFLNLIIH